MTAPETVPPSVPRPLIVTLVVGLALVLIFLLPGRSDGATVPGAAGRFTLDMTRLELDEPPPWALQRGNDEVWRNLDRLAWGGPMALRTSLEILDKHRGELAPVLLSRLRALGGTDPVLSAKLVTLLGGEDPQEPGVMDALIRRALSDSGLETQAALRVLARIDHERALDGIVPRLMDADPSVREVARAALAKRAADGDSQARGYVMAELEIEAATPDPTYLAVLDHLGEDAEVEALLHRIEREAPERVAFIARTALVRRGDPEAMATFEAMIASDDPVSRANAVHGLLAVHVVLGWDHWDRIARHGDPDEVLPLAGIMILAIDIGHPQAPKAAALLEALGMDRTNAVHVEITDRLYNRRHPWALEATRHELREAIGGMLSESVDRVIDGPAADAPEMAEIAARRLETEALRPADQVLLLRLLAHVAPERAVDRLVEEALDPASGIATQMPALIVRTEAIGLARLEQELGDPAADALFIKVAGDLESGAALPGLKRILLADTTLPPLRQAALDCLALLRDGPRAEVLREAVDFWKDPALASRARLIYWNYL
ncbi:MAG: hypothetical protein ACYTG2_04890 [Planctomycetota bacterium]|jgi:hypothetical protein